MIANTCGTCGKAIQTPAEQRGQQRKCPVCGDQFVVGVDASADDDDSYGVAGARAAKAVPPAPAKPAGKPAGKSAAKKPKPAADAALPAGKAECPTCHELTPSDQAQCAYCGDVLAR